MTDHTPMQLEKYYTCYNIEMRLHIPYNNLTSARLNTGLLMFNALIQLNIDDGSGGSDVWM